MKKILLLLFLVPLVGFAQQVQMLTALSAAKASSDYSAYFDNAYQQFPDIPRGVLEAVAYGNTHIYHMEHVPGQEESCMGLPMVYGVMGLTLDGKGYFSNNLVYVSNLSGISTDDIIADPEKNILAYASAFNTIMTTLTSQAGAETKPDDIIFNTLAGLSELPQEDEGQIFALHSQLYSYFWFLSQPEFQATYRFPNHNFDLYTLFGEDNYRVLSSEHILISEDGVSNTYGNMFKSTGGNSAPTVQSTDYAPAIWNQAATCNFSSRSQAVTAVTIHDVEGSYASCISWFQNCNAGVSAHYVVRSSDGQVTQMVLESKKAWHVGTENGYTIGIEHEGYASQTGWYTTAMVQSSANLVKDICLSNSINPAAAYNGPSCNCHSTQPASVKIKGHQHNPGTGKVDPGINWPWGTFYSLINNTSTTCGVPSGLSATSVAANNATLGWAAVSGAMNYDIQYKMSSSSSWTTVSSSTNSVTITGLIAATSYDFKVRAVCSSAGTYSSSVSFTTAVALANDNCSTAEEIYPNTTCIQTAGNVAGATVSGLAKASCDGFSGTPKLLDVWYKFQATSTNHVIKVTPSASFDAVVALHTSCSGGQIGCADNGGGSGAAETITSTGLTVGTTYYIRVYAYGSSIPLTTTFNICLTGASAPSCGVPSGLGASSISLSSATLNWTAVSGTVSYNVQYKEVSSSTWTTVSASTNTVTINGLNISTAYEYKVQAVCSSAGTYSAVANFTTSSGSSSSTTITVGTATTPYSAHPFGTVYMDERAQYVFKKSELTAAGWTSSSPYLKSVSFYVSSVSPQAMGSFKVVMSHTSANSFTSTSFLTGTNTATVFTGTVSLVQGWNTLTFSTPFSYNGSSNLLMNICWDNSSFTHNSAVYANSYSNFQALYYRADLSGSGPCAKTTGSLSYYRPNAKFEFSSTLTISSPSSFSTQQNQEHRNGDLTSEAEPQFEIFPNPMEGEIMHGKLVNVESGSMMIRIYDLLGRELLSENVTLAEGEFSIPLNAELLKAGAYMVIGTTEAERFTKRLVVK